MEVSLKTKGSGSDDQEMTLRLPVETLMALQSSLGSGVDYSPISKPSYGGATGFKRDLSPMRTMKMDGIYGGTSGFTADRGATTTSPFRRKFENTTGRNSSRSPIQFRDPVPSVPKFEDEDDKQVKRQEAIHKIINSKVFTPKFWDVPQSNQQGDNGLGHLSNQMLMPSFANDPILRQAGFGGSRQVMRQHETIREEDEDSGNNDTSRHNITGMTEKSGFANPLSSIREHVVSTALDKFDKDLGHIFKRKDMDIQAEVEDSRVNIVLSPKANQMLNFARRPMRSDRSSVSPMRREQEEHHIEVESASRFLDKLQGKTPAQRSVREVDNHARVGCFSISGTCQSTKATDPNKVNVRGGRVSDDRQSEQYKQQSHISDEERTIGFGDHDSIRISVRAPPQGANTHASLNNIVPGLALNGQQQVPAQFNNKFPRAGFAKQNISPLRERPEVEEGSTFHYSNPETSSKKMRAGAGKYQNEVIVQHKDSNGLTEKLNMEFSSIPKAEMIPKNNLVQQGTFSKQSGGRSENQQRQMSPGERSLELEENINIDEDNLSPIKGRREITSQSQFYDQTAMTQKGCNDRDRKERFAGLQLDLTEIRNNEEWDEAGEDQSHFAEAGLDTPVMKALSSIQGKIEELNVMMGRTSKKNSSVKKFGSNEVHEQILQELDSQRSEQQTVELAPWPKKANSNRENLPDSKARLSSNSSGNMQQPVLLQQDSTKTLSAHQFSVAPSIAGSAEVKKTGVHLAQAQSKENLAPSTSQSSIGPKEDMNKRLNDQLARSRDLISLLTKPSR